MTNKYGYNYKALRITRDVLGVFKKEISKISPLPFCFVKDTDLAEPYNGIVINPCKWRCGRDRDTALVLEGRRRRRLCHTGL